MLHSNNGKGRVKSRLTPVVLKGFRSHSFVTRCFEPNGNSIMEACHKFEKCILSHLEILKGLLCKKLAKLGKTLKDDK